MNDMQTLVNIAGMTAELIESGELVRVVRCKDCKWRANNGATSTKWLPCMDNRYDDDWFCADGEHK